MPAKIRSPPSVCAADLGAEMWELDTQLTKDGVVVVSHDDHLERVFGVDKRISEMIATELAGTGRRRRSDLRGGRRPCPRDRNRALCSS